MGNVIVIQKDGEIQVWGSLTRICKHHLEFRYGYVKHKSYPFIYKGWKFIKTKYNK